MQTAVGVASLIGLIAIGQYHGEKEYFDYRYVIGCVAAGFGMLALRLSVEAVLWTF
jgi:hypothetical protein